MRPELRAVYDGMRRIGAVGASSGQPVKVISQKLDISKNRLMDALEHLEGMGVVGHQTAGHETTWFTRR